MYIHLYYSFAHCNSCSRTHWSHGAWAALTLKPRLSGIAINCPWCPERWRDPRTIPGCPIQSPGSRTEGVPGQSLGVLSKVLGSRTEGVPGQSLGVLSKVLGSRTEGVPGQSLGVPSKVLGTCMCMGSCANTPKVALLDSMCPVGSCMYIGSCVPKPTSALFRVDKPESKVEVTKLK